MTSSAYQSTPNLSIAPTQNTAPVFEFRCLYTHDLRKKKKIWQDGSLRFHTFNRRVMVWDDSKNHIGDVFVGKDGRVNEGDELRLDKGVLIDVGERIGRTETDLAPILERRRPEEGSSPTRPAVPQPYLARSVTQASQSRPKSLAAVLGVSRGAIGRARLPTQSPYEARLQNTGFANATEDSGQIRPAKRQKVSIQGSDLYSREQNASSRPRHRALAARSNKNEILGPSKSKSNHKHREVIEVSSDATEGWRLPPSSPPSPVAKQTSRRSEAVSNIARPLVRPSPVKASSRKTTKSTKNLSHDVSPPIARQSEFPPAIVADLEPEQAQLHPEPELNLLQFSKQPPRKRIMYRDLLPGRANGARSLRKLEPPLDSLTASLAEQQRRVRDRLKRSKRASDDWDDMDQNHAGFEARTSHNAEGRREQQSSVSPRSKRNTKTTRDSKNPSRSSSRRRNSPKKTPTRPLRSMSPHDSPLFVPESPSAHLPHRPNASAQSSLPTPSPPASALPLTPTPILSPPYERAESHSASRRSSESSILPGMIALSPDPQILPPYVLNSKNPLVQKELQSIPNTTSEPRTFRRVYSENDAQMSNDPCPPPPRAPVVNLPRVAERPVEKAKIIAKPAPKLRKSMSDMTGLRKTATTLAAATGPVVVPEEPADLDMGPWSKEAADLFDWWPPGRERPAGAVQVDTNTKPTTEEVVSHPRCGGFESARKGFLSEQIEALEAIAVRT